MALFSTLVVAEQTEKIKWDKKPISITLPLNKERMIIFPSDVRVNVPSSIRHQLRTISNDGIIYWQADSPFEKQRVKVQLIDSGKIIMIDLAASGKRTKASAIEVLIKKEVVRGGSASQEVVTSSLDYVQLTRLAAQSLYSPERLISMPTGVSRSQLAVNDEMDTLIRGQIIKATPMVSWQSNGIYVTAVKLQNMTNNTVILDPRDIRGHWESATFQHVTLEEAGTTQDTTSLYLISKRPYEESL